MPTIFNLQLPRSFYRIWTVLFIVKILTAYFLPPVDDEAYYWVWGQNLALGYLNHPGMVGWINGLGLAPGFFRIPFIVVNQLSVLILACTGREHFNFDERKLLLILVVFNLIPVTGAGACLALPDSLLIFFWILSIHSSLRLLTNSDDLSSAALLGISLGLGFCSKYHMVLAPLTLILFCLFWHRAFFGKRKTIFIIVIFGLAAALPTLLWNQQNDWISFYFQLRHGLASQGFSATRVLGYIADQTLIMSPFLILGCWKFQPVNPKGALLKYFAFVPLAFFLLSSTRAPVEGNWPSIAAPALALSVVLAFENLAKFSIAYYSSIYAFLAAVFLFAPAQLPNKAKEPFAMRTFARETLSLPILYGSSYQVSSQLWLQQGRVVYKAKGLSQYVMHDMYDLWKQPDLPTKFHIAYKTSSSIPRMATHVPIQGSNKSYGIYSVVEMIRNQTPSGPIQ